MKKIKGKSAIAANRILQRSGQFWQREYFDHRPRNAESFREIFWYILKNPEKAGLVPNWRDWPHVYVNDEFSDWLVEDSDQG